MKKLIWFRQDLRISDHAALWHATQHAECLAYVVLSPEQWRIHDDAPIKIDFYLRQLQQLKQQLDVLNIPLVIQTIPLWNDVATHLLALCQQFQIQAVHANAEFAVNEQQRDALCQHALQQHEIDFYLHQDRTLFPIASIRNQSGQPYKVFSAFKQNCYQRLNLQLPACYPEISVQSALSFTLDDAQSRIPTLSDLGYLDISAQVQQLWPVGEKYAQQQLDQFIADDVFNYQQLRDFPALNATSQLAAYLNIGMLSIRQCLQALFGKQHGQFSPENAGQQCWLDELLWREFYQHILFDFPEVSKHLPFQAKTKQLQWRNNEADFEAWKNGQTGIPIVDAGMRQLKATGWMHNRVRMICAMFLSKNLLIDWRKGEQWFMQQLIDGDLAANNGGWQWSASTGTDAVPYFRIFNPISQSEKFDTKGEYLRQWLPELASLDDKTIHAPYAKGYKAGLGYPQPIVDLKTSRVRAIEAFKALG
ncbi:cryptochrome/photolyase family protein [Acinetobacter sp. MD2(2019)]|uniref:cryptochrome/photolyase family protein n=1 Tax=Acinetobacter sp. MD2(2019) TaxID=2605273 RepID=UPI002D1F2AAF|nr:FAD-binding domain-containing protein [Acinetobacter sp. MD2(2019)]MEB3754091.1 deoxyribodipyrimidine photo-lyase [Acinetobacter sp. MD2(2019)]